MGEMSKKRNNQKKTKKGCMPFCHCPKIFVSEVVSIKGVKSQEKKKQPKTRTTKRAVLMF